MSASSSKIKIEYYYDCLSPFSYFAFVALQRYCNKDIWTNVELELKPFLLGGVMASTKNLPPAARPWAAATAKEGAQHIKRNQEFFNLPDMLGGPANFFGPDGPSDKRGLSRDFRYQRTLTAVRRLHPEALADVSRLVFEQIWASKEARDAKGNVAMDEKVLVNLCEKAGLPRSEAERCVKELDSAETKELLKATVDEAVRRGGYGSPTIIVTGASGREEMVFFGSDRFEQLAFACGLPWYGPDPSRPTMGAAKL
eukprot:gnl/TRDRNA2_/TRDRNA2_155265_c0_seq1.p1 gnl/TRDRNA2_/TRDRNA2_155265_c0~~gnl/TRDRNA2_/TRDRNA2_155265_c0_seq1.p1  ORF type:complete len:255 (-),score=43.80 gnl/TRDRNA2_/TRDRNA2_155265_c0_seq1:112-876(-)